MGPDWNKTEGDLSGVITVQGQRGTRRGAAWAQDLMELVRTSIQGSGKWDGKDHCFLESSAMRSNGKEPQSAHYDWKYGWVDKATTTRRRQGQGDRLDKSRYLLSVLIPTTQAGMYFQVWDPEEEGYRYILHVKIGEVLIFDPECLHGGGHWRSR